MNTRDDFPRLGIGMSKQRRLGLLAVALSFCTTTFSYGSESESKSGGREAGNRTGFWCPDLCTCSSSARIVDCSARGLARVPEVAASTTRLYLHDNAISRLESTQFHHLHHLTYLILANNVISQIFKESFQGLHSLKYLILDHNLITELPAGIFKNLKSLETVSLAHNRLQTLAQETFTNNHHISLINIQNNALEAVERGTFSHLKELHTLDLQGNHLKDGVLETLIGCHNLTVLKLTNNRISHLPPAGLQLPSLQLLYLSNNVIEELPPHFLNGSSNVTRIEIRDNSLTTLPTALLHNTTSLRSIHLDRNNITYLPVDTFQNLQMVERIFLSHNMLKTLPSLLFHNLTALVSLHLESNELASIGDHSFSHLPALETLYLQHNQITRISDSAFVELPRLKYLGLYGNPLPVEQLGAGVLNSLKSLMKIHLDPFPCSCQLSHQLSHLSAWGRRNGVRGLYCTTTTGSVVALTQAMEECHGTQEGPALESSGPEVRTDGVSVPLEVAGMIADGSQPKTVDTSHVQSSDCCNNDLIHQLERRVAELQHRVARLEVAASESCEKWVCLHRGIRLEPGDTWAEEGGTCHCSQGGEVGCKSVHK